MRFFEAKIATSDLETVDGIPNTRRDEARLVRRSQTGRCPPRPYFLVLCGLLCMLLILGRVDIRPAAAQEGVSGGSVCSGFQTQLAIGAQGTVLPGSPNNLRENPSPSAARIGSIPGGDGFVVIDGPECAEGYTWWLVQYRGTTGWTVEGTAAERYVTAGMQSSGGVLIAGGNSRSVPQDLIEGIIPSDVNYADYSDLMVVKNICASQPGSDIAYRAPMSGGIGAFALADYSPSEALFTADHPPIPVPLESGAVIDLPLLHEGDLRPLFGFSPAICVTESSGFAEAISPGGESVAPYIQGLGDVTQVQIPARAYIEPGDWRLRVGDYEITVQIPELPRLSAPFVWAFHSSLIERDGFVILGGYVPDDEIVLITNGGEVVQTSPNAQGYAAVQFNNTAALAAIVPQSGQHVEILLNRIFVSHDRTTFPPDGYSIPEAMSRDILYNAIWLGQSFDSLNWTCPGAMPIRMVASQPDPATYALVIDRLNMRQTPGANGAVVTTLSRGDVVQVIDGVECSDNKTWWQVARYDAATNTGQTGWVAEGEGGQYFFEPVSL
ncbi:MAG: SH3 domain-containing protein [Anaerolineae bacterium]